MINSVRNTVLSILNKNNYGYLSPSDFNLFSKQAQLEIYEDYVQRYNSEVNRVNMRTAGTGFADMEKLIREFLETFMEKNLLVRDANNKYFLPSQVTTSDDLYRIETVLLLDGEGVPIAEFEPLPVHRVYSLNASNLTAPTLAYPAYEIKGDSMYAYPSTISTDGIVEAHYLRQPRDPKWTYISLTNGEPVFNQSQPDYQDFEIPIDDEPKLVLRILQMAGLSIREYEIYKAAEAEEQFDKQEERQ